MRFVKDQQVYVLNLEISVNKQVVEFSCDKDKDVIFFKFLLPRLVLIKSLVFLPALKLSNSDCLSVSVNHRRLLVYQIICRDKEENFFPSWIWKIFKILLFGFQLIWSKLSKGVVIFSKHCFNNHETNVAFAWPSFDENNPSVILFIFIHLKIVWFPIF